MLKVINQVFYVLVFMSLLTSCEKSEGEGGASEIRGKVYIIRFDGSYTFAMDTIPASEEDVYIIYGKDKSTYDDDFKTSFDGSYSFEHLIKGSYKIFAYTNDSTGSAEGFPDNSLPKIPVILDVEISSDETKELPSIYLIDNDL